MELSSTQLGLSDPSALTEAAAAFAAEHLADYVLGHCVRSFRFAGPIAAASGLKPGQDYDEELVFLICLLHDLGVSEIGNGDQRFELDGADVARRFLLEAGVDAVRADAVWTGIALHTSDGIAARVSPEAGVAQIGIATDIAGLARDAVPADVAAQAVADWPRHDLGYTFAQEIAAQITDNRAKGSPINFPGHVAGLFVPPGEVTTWHDMVEQAGWGDQPAYRRAGGDEAAETPERLAELFVARFHAGDLTGLTALYEKEAVLGKPSGEGAKGQHAIHDDLRQLIASGTQIALKSRGSTVVAGRSLALLSHTVTLTAPDGTVTVLDSTEVARRQSDGRWLYAIDDPFFNAGR